MTARTDSQFLSRRVDDGREAKKNDRRIRDPAMRKKPQRRNLDVEPLRLAARFAAAKSAEGSDLALNVADRVLWALSVWHEVPAVKAKAQRFPSTGYPCLTRSALMV
jgi:hypothetical protein